MNEILVIKNEVFLDILRDDGDIISEFISIIELLEKVKCKIVLPSNDYAEETFKVMHDRFKTNEVLKFQVIKYGKPIYMKSLYTKVMFESRTMSEYMDKEHFRRTQEKYSHMKFLEVMNEEIKG